jgi:hypothetical protein
MDSHEDEQPIQKIKKKKKKNSAGECEQDNEAFEFSSTLRVITIFCNPMYHTYIIS